MHHYCVLWRNSHLPKTWLRLFSNAHWLKQNFLTHFWSLFFDESASNFDAWWLIGCGFESNRPLAGPGIIGGMPSMEFFLRDPSPYLREFQRKPGKTPNGYADKRNRGLNLAPPVLQFRALPPVPLVGQRTLWPWYDTLKIILLILVL